LRVGPNPKEAHRETKERETSRQSSNCRALLGSRRPVKDCLRIADQRFDSNRPWQTYGDILVRPLSTHRIDHVETDAHPRTRHR